MNISKLLLLLIFFLLLCPLVTLGQLEDYDQLKSLPVQTETINILRSENNLRNIPFGLGLEAAFGGTFDSQGEVFPGFLFFIDLNLSKRIVFFKAEYGKLFFSKNKESSNYASLGLNYKITEDRKHNFYLHGGAFGIWGKSGSGGVGGGAGFFLAFRYRYSIADQVGFVTSLRYPMGSFKSIMVTAGFQFFAF